MGKLIEALWERFKVEHIQMHPQTLENVRKHYNFVLFRNGKMYCKFTWYELWVEVPLITEEEAETYYGYHEN